MEHERPSDESPEPKRRCTTQLSADDVADATHEEGVWRLRDGSLPAASMRMLRLRMDVSSRGDMWSVVRFVVCRNEIFDEVKKDFQSCIDRRRTLYDAYRYQDLRNLKNDLSVYHALKFTEVSEVDIGNASRAHAIISDTIRGEFGRRISSRFSINWLPSKTGHIPKVVYYDTTNLYPNETEGVKSRIRAEMVFEGSSDIITSEYKKAIILREVMNRLRDMEPRPAIDGWLREVPVTTEYFEQNSDEFLSMKFLYDSSAVL